jgi:hypothetical protein
MTRKGVSGTERAVSAQRVRVGKTGEKYERQASEDRTKLHEGPNPELYDRVSP